MACPECREPVADRAEPRRKVAVSGVLEVVFAGGCPGPQPPLPPPTPEPDPSPSSALGPESRPGALCPLHGRPHRGSLRVQRVHRARVSSPRAGTAGRGAPGARELSLHPGLHGLWQVQLPAAGLGDAAGLGTETVEVAKTQALAQAQDREQQLRGHLEALAHYDHRIWDLLEQLDDQTFLQESQFLEPPVSLGPLTPPQWDEDHQLGGLKESLRHQCDLLLDKRGHPRLPAEAADLGPMGKADTDLSLLLWTQLPLPLELRDYQNLTFDPDSASRHLYLSRQDQQTVGP
ncbi:Tripartite Motif-Containing Protein 65 [Manis pentadactyla]|nr:Tripartite Motif-Containing Protein 65 [Manis pentadactyla]